MKLAFLALLSACCCTATPLVITNPIGINGSGYYWFSLGDTWWYATGSGTNSSGDTAFFSEGSDLPYAFIDGVGSALFTVELGTDGFLELFSVSGQEIAQAPLIATLVNLNTTTQFVGTYTTTFDIDPPSATPEPRSFALVLMAMCVLAICRRVCAP